MLAYSPVDIAAGTVISDAEAVIPLAGRLFAPLFDFPSYFLTLPDPKAQLLSWLAWLSIAWIVFALLRMRAPFRKKILPIFRGLLVTAAIFILFIIYCIFVPMPGYRMVSKNPDEIFLDLHSHTIYSHDGIATPERSFRWHTNHGFGGWAITEHDRIGPAAEIQRGIIKNHSLAAAAIPGQEVNFKRVHLNILGAREDIDAKRYENLKDLIEDAHRLGGAVIVPHYWAEKKSAFSMEDLADAGADGFEIAGNASVPLTLEKQREIIALCREKGAVPVSGTNWHGWRNFCTVWTGFIVPGWEKMDAGEREREVISALRNREKDRFRVIEYRRQAGTGRANHTFEPFTGSFFYFTSINSVQKLSWLFWIAATCLVLPRIKNKRPAAVLFWSAACLLLLAKSILILNTWKTVANVNEILPEAAKGLLAMALLTALLALSSLRKAEKK